MRARSSVRRCDGGVTGTTPETFGEDTPFLLIARIKCKKGKKADYLKIAAVADNGVIFAGVSFRGTVPGATARERRSLRIRYGTSRTRR